MIALCEGVWQTNGVERTDKMPRLMERDDVMRMAVNLGRAEEEDRSMDEEIVASMNLDKEFA